MMEDWSSRRDLILVALLEGPNSSKELAEFTGMRRPEVEMALVSLRAAGLVVETEVKGLLRRKTVYRLTEEGIREAQEARKRLERVAEEIRQRAGEGDVEKVEELLTSYALFLPLLLNLQLIGLALLQSLGAFHDLWPKKGSESAMMDESEDWAEF
jgi:DNA-binding MarR family transcriptional regulator